MIAIDVSDIHQPSGSTRRSSTGQIMEDHITAIIFVTKRHIKAAHRVPTPDHVVGKNAG